MDIENDEKLNMLFDRRGTSENRKKTYVLVLEEMYELLGKTPSELIKEAKIQQKPDWDKREFLDIEDRDISVYFLKYHNYLKNVLKNNKGSIILKMVTLKSFYKEFNVEVPKTPEKKNKIPRVRKKDIPSWDDVKLALEKVESLKNKAIILFIATSGLRGGDTAKLTIGDFLEATEEYHNGTLEDLLKQDSDNIIPSWYIDPQKTSQRGNLCITFNTPESVKAIFNYLEQRIETGYSVEENTPLFRSKQSVNNHFLNSDSIGRIFRTINENIFDNAKDNLGKGFFRAQNLRKLFITTCSTNILKAAFEVEESSTKAKDLDHLAVLGGHKPSKGTMTTSYDAIEPEDIQPYYLHLTKYLSIGEVEPKGIKSKDYIELQNRFDKIEDKLNKHDAIIKTEDENEERQDFYNNQVFKSEILEKIMQYVLDKYGMSFFADINVIRKIKKLNEEKVLNKMKQREWKKKIDKIIADIPTPKTP